MYRTSKAIAVDYLRHGHLIDSVELFPKMLGTESRRSDSGHLSWRAAVECRARRHLAAGHSSDAPAHARQLDHSTGQRGTDRAGDLIRRSLESVRTRITSMHTQAIYRVAPALVVRARDRDGFVQTVEMPTRVAWLWACSGTRSMCPICQLNGG